LEELSCYSCCNIFSLLLLTTWISTFAAPISEVIPTQTGVVQSPDAPTAFGYDFVMTKLDLASPMSVGTIPNAYKLTVNVTINITGTIINGPSVIDTIPTGMTPTAASGIDWTCSLFVATNPKTVRCNYSPNITSTKANQTISLSPIFISVRVATDIAPKVTNIAVIQDPDDNIPNNTSSVVSTIKSADLQIKKTESPSLIEEGDTILYTMVITNNGPTTATNVIVSDTIATAYLTNTHVTLTPGFVSTFVGGVVQWTNPAFSKGARATLSVTSVARPGSNGQAIVNAATVTSDTPDWNPANNRSDVTFVIGGLAISKFVDRSIADVGEPIVWTIVITNTGTTNASNVLVTDVFTPSLDITASPTRSPTIGFISRVGNTVNYNNASLAPGVPVRITVKTRANKNVTSAETISNRAKVSWGSPKVTITSNSAHLDVSPAVDIAVTKSVDVGDGAEVQRSDILNYSIDVENIGSFPAANVVITDLLSTNLNFLSYNIGSTDAITSTSQGRRFHTWNIVDPINPGDTVSINLRAQVRSDAGNGSLVVNKSCAHADDEVFIDNNCGRTANAVVIPPQPSMSITYSVTPTQGRVGDVFTFKIRVTNNSSEDVTGIQVSNSYPTTVDFQTVQTDQGTLTTNSSTNTFVVTIGTLVPADTATITVLMKDRKSVG
jgi:uncharacterized repeat protein (TIGR01451 family)